MHLLKDYFRFFTDNIRINNWFKNYKFAQNIIVDKSRYKNQVLLNKDSYSIAFLIPGMPKLSGGHTSILRLGTYLEEFGHKVYYLSVDDTSLDKLNKNAKINLPYFKGTALTKEHLDNKFDIGVATLWNTAYTMYGKDNFSYKCYFVQDFEPFFYSIGDQFFFAKNTYEFNYHIITLGKWNAEQIDKHVSSDISVDSVDFPVEIKQYPIVKRRINIKNKLNLAVYVKLDGRRAPIFLLESLDLLNKELRSRGVACQVFIFGLDKKIKVPLGKNLGKLKTENIKELYSKCHLGVVASLSNVSLIPFEMIASGLPVIEILNGSAPSFFNNSEMIFTDFYPKEFVNKITYYLEKQDELQKMLITAQESIKSKTWENSSKQFIDKLIARRE